MITLINSVIFTFRQRANRLSLVQFRTGQHNQQILINPNVPVQTMNFLTQLLNNILMPAGNQNIIIALYNFLEQSFNVFQTLNGGSLANHEKLAVMIIDDVSSFTINPLTMSSELNQRGITLTIFASVTPTYEIWDFYDTLACNTGGHYIPLVNGLIILGKVIALVTAEEDTLRQAFLHVSANRSGRNSAMTNLIDNMNEPNQITDGVGDLSFDHGLS